MYLNKATAYFRNWWRKISSNNNNISHLLSSFNLLLSSMQAKTTTTTTLTTHFSLYHSSYNSSNSSSSNSSNNNNNNNSRYSNRINKALNNIWLAILFIASPSNPSSLRMRLDCTLKQIFLFHRTCSSERQRYKNILNLKWCI
jgi:hypothetical protein